MDVGKLRIAVVVAGLLSVLAVLLILADRAEIARLSARVTELESRIAASHPELLQSEATPTRGRAASLVDGAPVRGRVGAPVTIVAFMDFASPFGARSHPTLLRVLDAYPDDVRVVFRHHPLPTHRDAPLVHRAAIAAGQQGSFWEMHDRIFGEPQKLGRGDLIAHAKALELDVRRFERDLDAEQVGALLARDIAEAQSRGLATSPVFFINEKRVSGAQPFANFKVLVERELARSPAGRAAGS